jgi:putative (di)nucleoside polyphosphate hydrolase
MGKPKRYFRAGVGAVVLDGAGRVLIFERSDISGAWQFPQGGLEEEEDPESGVWRELREETGLTSADVALLARYPEPLVYELPHPASSKKTGMGQVQYWFFFRIRQPRQHISVPVNGEFRRAVWADFGKAVEQAVNFRKRVYERLRTFYNANLNNPER